MSTWVFLTAVLPCVGGCGNRAVSISARLLALQAVLLVSHSRSSFYNAHAFAGRPVVSIQWGAWSGVGMVASSAAVLARMQRSGIKAVTPAAGLQALQAILPVASGTVSPCHALITALRDTVPTLKL